MKFFLLFLLFSAVQLWEAQFLKNSQQKQAVCNDGTPPLYATDFVQNSTSWLLYLPGGGMCFTPDLCMQRQAERKVMTSTTGHQAKLDFQHASGIFSRDCSVNPQFCKSNFVYIFYCSSDLWSGQNTIKLPNRQDFHFRGKNIVLEVVKELLLESHLKALTSFFIGGNSAGGYGAQLLADRVNLLLEEETKREVPEFRAILDSSVLISDPVYRPQDCEKTGGLCGVTKTLKLAYKNHQNFINEECKRDNALSPQFCIGEIGLSYMKTKAIAVVYQFDVIILMMEGVNLMNPSEAQKSYIFEAGQRTKQMLRYHYDQKSLDSVYVSPCLYHTMTLFKEEFLINEVGGKTAAQAVYEWVSKGKRKFVEEKCETPMCNERCSQASQMMMKDYASRPKWK